MQVAETQGSPGKQISGWCQGLLPETVPLSSSSGPVVGGIALKIYEMLLTLSKCVDK